MSASLFNADGLAGYVEFDEETHRKLVKCELDSVKQICKALKLHEEPFETAIPTLIDRCHDRYMHLMQNDATMTNGSGHTGASDCRLRRTVGVISGFEIPLLMTPSVWKREATCRLGGKQFSSESQTPACCEPRCRRRCQWTSLLYRMGKGGDIISEIRADEHGFGHPDIFTTKSAMFLSYRAENQTHVLPLTEDGEIYEYDPDTEYTQDGKPPIPIPSFYSDAPTLCVGRIPNSSLTVQITTRKLEFFEMVRIKLIEEWVSFENEMGRMSGARNDEIRFASLHLTDTTAPRVWFF